ncbi:TetR/AcrR family transcriptional regulator [Curtobacterium sp. ISL-83]|uniref:TetR/AcrR family transcriptional regulator n=1 Tax=Curtobacterium sp. ISL-83 TaxID=2819145 RepID=UPI001BE94C67|nr:TetR/AcrR family transcriptional regulator [Curtobacterium sp. ISL-83]MBT2503503.1 TetR/AcrR family transcriptional regulator [Curtobacterium sp. ISL-83]
MTERPFHHGNLRSALLDEATTMLRETGLDGLSLRELARRAGVSHGAPRSHFRDRQALLDALAEVGFDRLTDDVRTALAAGGALEHRFRRVARAYVDFAIDDAALMDLMFQAKTDGQVGAVRDAAARLFGVLDDAMGASPSTHGTEPRETFKLLFAATLQGIARLVASRRISRAQGNRLVDEAVAVLLGSALLRSAVASERG